jgi:hypothetical protein
MYRICLYSFEEYNFNIKYENIEIITYILQHFGG